MFLLHFQCEDITGKYKSVVVIDKIRERYVAYYVDFENVITILPKRTDIDRYVPQTLARLLAEESGIYPTVKFLKSEYWSLEA